MEVFEKIQAQQEKLEATDPAWMVGRQLADICRTDPRCEKILSEDLDSEAMSLKKAADMLQKYADDNHGKARRFCIPPNTAEQLLRKFYGLPDAVPDTAEPPTEDVFDLSAFM